MKLTIMYQDYHVEEIGVCRVFTIDTINAGQWLYYETLSHQRGKGKYIPMSEVKCWEVNASIQGGSLNLF